MCAEVMNTQNNVVLMLRNVGVLGWDEAQVCASLDVDCLVVTRTICVWQEQASRLTHTAVCDSYASSVREWHDCRNLWERGALQADLPIGEETLGKNNTFVLLSVLERLDHQMYVSQRLTWARSLPPVALLLRDPDLEVLASAP